MYNFQSVSEAYEESRKFRDLGQTAPFPPYVTFELTNCCNFKCKMCYRTYVHKERKDIELDFLKTAHWCSVKSDHNSASKSDYD